MPAAVSGHLADDGCAYNRTFLSIKSVVEADDESKARDQVKKFIKVCMISHKFAHKFVRRRHLLKATMVAESQQGRGMRQ